MKIIYEKTFLKDLEKIKEKEVLIKLKENILNIENIEKITNIKNI